MLPIAALSAPMTPLVEATIGLVAPVPKEREDVRMAARPNANSGNQKKGRTSVCSCEARWESRGALIGRLLMWRQAPGIAPEKV